MDGLTAAVVAFATLPNKMFGLIFLLVGLIGVLLLLTPFVWEHLVPPIFKYTEAELDTVVKRGNTYTTFGTEAMGDYWIKLLMIVAPFALLIFCAYTHNTR